MDEVQQKYTNFKRFIRSEAPESPWMQYVIGMPINDFLMTIADHSSGRSVDEILDKIMEATHMRRGDFRPKAVDTFKLYIEYFGDVAGQMYPHD